MAELYRFLTGPEDASFCHKVTAALCDGWTLYGSPSMTTHPDTGAIVCGQAVIKQVADEYDPERKLTGYSSDA